MKRVHVSRCRGAGSCSSQPAKKHTDDAQPRVALTTTCQKITATIDVEVSGQRLVTAETFRSSEGSHGSLSSLNVTVSTRKEDKTWDLWAKDGRLLSFPGYLMTTREAERVGDPNAADRGWNLPVFLFLD